MKIAIIVAVSANNVIGKDGKLPWHIPEDLKFFKQKTSNHTIIMGRKTFESIGKPLPNRQHIILSKSNFKFPGTRTVIDLKAALTLAEITNRRSSDEVFIIGGATVYEEALKLNIVDKIYLTCIDKEFEGDTYFPKLSSLSPIWLLTHNLPIRISEGKDKLSFSISIYEKVI